MTSPVPGGSASLVPLHQNLCPPSAQISAFSPLLSDEIMQLTRRVSAESGLLLLRAVSPQRPTRCSSANERSLASDIGMFCLQHVDSGQVRARRSRTQEDLASLRAGLRSGFSSSSDMSLATPSSLFSPHLSSSNLQALTSSNGSELFSPFSGSKARLSVLVGNSSDEESDTDNQMETEDTSVKREVQRTNRLGTDIITLGGGPATLERALKRLSGTPSGAPAQDPFALPYSPRLVNASGINGSFVLLRQPTEGDGPQEAFVFKPTDLSCGMAHQVEGVQQSRFGILPSEQAKREVIGSYLGHFDGVPFTAEMSVPMPKKLLPMYAMHNARMIPPVASAAAAAQPSGNLRTTSSLAANTFLHSDLISLRGSAQEFARDGIPLNATFTLKEVKQDVQVETEEDGIKKVKTVEQIIQVEVPFDFAERVGKLSVESLQRLAKFDIRTCNTDRHRGNLLLQENFTTTVIMEQPVPVHVGSKLVLIDHGCIASERFKDPGLFCWMMWPKKYPGVEVFRKAFLEPFSDQLKQEIASCHWAVERQKILGTFPDFSLVALQTLEISLLLQQKCAAKGLTPFQMACFLTMPPTEERDSLTASFTPMFRLYHAAANFSEDAALADVNLIGNWLDHMIDELYGAIEKREIAGDSFQGICDFLEALAKKHSNSHLAEIQSIDTATE